MKIQIFAIGRSLSLLAIAQFVRVQSFPGEILYGCTPAYKEWEGDYAPWSGDNTKNAHSHLTFDDGPFPGVTDTILDILKEYNTPATFFLVADGCPDNGCLNEDTRYLVDRMIDEGHTIGVHSKSHKNLQYGNETLFEQEIKEATEIFTDFIGYRPKLFRPPYGSLDHRSSAYLKEMNYTVVLWSAGCVDWWFTDNDKDLDTSIAAMRYGLAEAGGIVCMHDKAQAVNDGERLRKFLDDTWNFWKYVDFNTCIGRGDVDDNPYAVTYTPLLPRNSKAESASNHYASSFLLLVTTWLTMAMV